MHVLRQVLSRFIEEILLRKLKFYKEKLINFYPSFTQSEFAIFLGERASNLLVTWRGWPLILECARLASALCGAGLTVPLETLLVNEAKCVMITFGVENHPHFFDTSSISKHKKKGLG